MKVTQSMISKYKNLVHRNCHGEVLEEMAKDLKVSHYAVLFDSINKIHDIEGSLNRDVYAVREGLRQEFKGYLEQHLPKEEFETISRFV